MKLWPVQYPGIRMASTCSRGYSTGFIHQFQLSAASAQ
ncbi:Uncharacterised protein [Burkholderia oklahomensis]|nr:Uncharacterised protein [Burkholderia oklahomensis]